MGQQLNASRWTGRVVADVSWSLKCAREPSASPGHAAAPKMGQPLTVSQMANMITPYGAVATAW
jgi:hypothetical protein